MTTGEGGMVTTNNSEMVKKMKSMREFEKSKKYLYKLSYINWLQLEIWGGKFINGINAIKKRKKIY